MPLPEIVDGDWDAVRESIRMMAATINKQRRRITDLEAALSTGATASTDAVPEPPAPGTPGVFVPLATCMTCGKEKEPGRIELTCRACGRARAAAIREGGAAAREAIMREACGNCSRPMRRSTRILCVPCGAAFRKFKESLSP